MDGNSLYNDMISVVERCTFPHKKGNYFELLSYMILLKYGTKITGTKVTNVWLVNNIEDISVIPDSFKSKLMHYGKVDYGADIILKHHDDSISLIQCKCYKKYNKGSITNIFDVSDHLTRTGFKINKIILMITCEGKTTRFNGPGRLLVDKIYLENLLLNKNPRFNENIIAAYHKILTDINNSCMDTIEEKQIKPNFIVKLIKSIDILGFTKCCF